MYRYRVAVIRRNVDALPPDAELREHVYVHATNPIAAQLLARAITGASIAMDPERLGEVQAPEESAERICGCALSERGGCVVFA